ncbi:MAG: ribosome biogenesis GTP-binding protein YihA/YsxC [Bacteroidales bacterium]|jgi:GTP-binding protein|nr:ribosome biogenesis GTP-binding protein YihA/YsxC [Bacteroidales bacterium]
MKIRKAEFLISVPSVAKCPDLKNREYAFIGRSNVGKSSLINMLTNTTGLAKTSGTPGKTQLINYFSINDGEFYFVDLPGYGYARISKFQREKWQKMLADYFKKRENLYCTFVLIDSRIEAQLIDIEFINWLGKNGLPFVVVFTKGDKKIKTKSNPIVSFKYEMSKYWDELPQMFISSAATSAGKNEILEFLNT